MAIKTTLVRLAGLLSHEVVAMEAAAAAPPARTAVLLHGLLGSYKNWRGPAKRLVERHPDWRVLAVDLRGHGDTSVQARAAAGAGFPAPHTVEACAQDLAFTLSELGVASPDAVIGHSFGGKVALSYLEQTLDGAAGEHAPPAATWVLDSLPGQISRDGLQMASGRDNSVAHVIQSVGAVAQPFSSKQELIETLTGEHGVAMAIAKWMTTNLTPSLTQPGALEFTFEHSVCAELFQAYGDTDLLPLLERVETGDGTAGDVEVHFVKAMKNASWRNEQINGPLMASAGSQARVKVHELEAGHWVHVDNLNGLLELFDRTFAEP
mmetsp:Transcript_35973/g.113043  ORF Transcript_35973/g.113043 Transcript_35973/m.113043 type:complete len:322 (-) Transcript_35973:137-1102(-)